MKMLDAIEIESRNGHKRYQCPHCDYKFDGEAVVGGLREYEVDPDTLMCPKCKKKFHIPQIVKPFWEN